MLELRWRFLPSRSGLEPEDLRRDVAVFCGGEQKTGHLGIGLGGAEIQFLAIALAQGFGIDADGSRNVGLRDAISRHCLHLPSLRRIGLMGAAAHPGNSAGRRSPATSVNERPSPSRVADWPVNDCHRWIATSTYWPSSSMA